MTKVLFCDLDKENRAAAISQMFLLSQRYNFPGNIWWKNEESIRNDLKDGYNPDEKFSFYVDDFGDVQTKIG